MAYILPDTIREDKEHCSSLFLSTLFDSFDTYQGVKKENKQRIKKKMSKIFSMFEQKDIFQTSCALLSGFDSDINELHLQYYRVIKRHQ